IRDFHVTGVQTCALPIFASAAAEPTLRALLSALTADPPSATVLEHRRAAVGDRSAAARARWAAEARAADGAGAVHPARAVAAVRSEGRRVGKAWRARAGW